MNDALEQAIKKLRQLSDAEQKLAAEVIEDFVQTPDKGVYTLTPEEQVDIEAAISEIERGEIASDAEVRAVFAKFRGCGSSFDSRP